MNTTMRNLLTLVGMAIIKQKKEKKIPAIEDME
jgi:hypothetical protein